MAQSGIRDRNIRSSAKFAKSIIVLTMPTYTASQAAIEKVGVVMPYDGVVVSVTYYIQSVTTTNAASAEIRKNGTTATVQSALTDFGASATQVNKPAALLTSGPGYVGGSPVFAAGDVLSLYLTTGTSDTGVNLTATVVTRPFLGSLERSAAGLVD